MNRVSKFDRKTKWSNW